MKVFGMGDRELNEDRDWKPRLLVVEDDADLLLAMVSVLEDQYEVIQAVNGRDGLEKARKQMPDLVVTDLMMPLLDGISLCRELKLDPEMSHVPVIILTAKASVDSQIEGLETGADDYVIKPVKMALLKVRIENLLKTRLMLREKFSQVLPGMTEAFSGDVLDRAFLEKAIAVLKLHLSEPEFGPEDLARELNMGLRSLQRKLKTVADRSPAKFITQTRMAVALDFLAGSALSVTEIAFKLGFEDSSNFSKLFKHEYAMSPTEYRNMHQTA